MASLLQLLLHLSEKAANLARRIRAEKTLFDLLVEEKTGEQKNKNFVHDFKTLADVLIQELIRHEVSKQHPSLADHVLGEESNKFTNTLGETIVVAVQDTEQQTCSLLTKVLDGNAEAAAILASIIHREVAMTTDELLATVQIDLDVDSVGIWIDPIDGTSEYIHGGGEGPLPADGICPVGLPLALVLIGVFDRATGQPLMGLINQPFAKYNKQDNSWAGQSLWGISYKNTNINNIETPKSDAADKKGMSVVMSRSEVPQFISAMEMITNNNVKYTGGAGYKVYCAIQQLVDAYVLSKGSTFKWDTCAPHSILKSLGGGIIDLAKGLSGMKESPEGSYGEAELQSTQLAYNQPDDVKGASPGQKWANAGGMIAYRKPEVALKILSELCVIKGSEEG
ncbi:inositol polyphosphate 1-phosphatase-like [Amphiura filiformis]|uniref:inositol polyphosphate 1-phosphatase-like n=1 Tax=Amphiura filiformis TaxID=82378 RepID=UPI003B220E6B